MIKEVVVVEGYHDLAKLKEIYPHIEVIITNGSEVTKETLEELKLLNELRGLILFLDPDYQGERIRRIINDYVGATKHAFLPKKKCINKNKTKVGIEHAKNDDIIDALSNVLTNKKHHDYILTIGDLYKLNLIGCKDAKNRRKLLSEKTGIGLSNGKTMVKKLNMFGITREEIIRIIRR